MKKHLQYLSYVVRHKWFVLRAGLVTGAPLWRLLIHDWSKFTPGEWFAYTNKFYGKPDYPNPVYWPGEEFRKAAEVEWRDRVDPRFDRAWLHHIHSNPHHWQHFVLLQDSGGSKILEMPGHFVREMVADWLGAGRAIKGTWEADRWYRENSSRMLLHPKTRLLVETVLADTLSSLKTGRETPSHW